jgi:16S rRNA (guanine527-N7)-methyltransferase
VAVVRCGSAVGLMSEEPERGPIRSNSAAWAGIVTEEGECSTWNIVGFAVVFLETCEVCHAGATMSTLTESEISELLKPFMLVPPVVLPPKNMMPKFRAYLDLLEKWNARTNLTAIRDPEEMVRRHFGESVFTADHLAGGRTMLDLGSGAGFPGLPVAILHPEVMVTLAESQNKKATFLREVVRSLELENVEVWGARAETMPAERRFHTVALRAVDNMAAALEAAAPRAADQMLILAGEAPVVAAGFRLEPGILIPGTQASFLYRAMRDQA